MNLPDWIAIGTTYAEPCPECGAPLESAYVRAPDVQDHWRGVPALACSDACGYARADGVR